MADASWGEGYVVDVDYTQGYFKEIAPSLLVFAGLLGNIQCLDTSGRFVYYELGCGNGLSLVLHAAANPQGDFIGVDFNPAHIHTARTLARERGVGNVTFIEKSFAELLEMDTPEASIIALHGVWSWVNDDNRAQITSFARKRLLPGGLLYVSYNALPGSAQVKPLQRLLLDHSKAAGGDLTAQINQSIAFAQRLDRAGAKYFAANPVAKARLDSFAKHDARYLAHEYFNENWEPYFHADVAADLKAAKLAYVGSANLIDNFDALVLTPELAKLVGESGDRTTSEMLKDYARNQVFRRDIFARGAPKSTSAQIATSLASSRYCLATPRSRCRLTLQTSAGEFTFSGGAYQKLLDALASGPKTMADLHQAQETARVDVQALRQAVFTMVAAGNVLPAMALDGESARSVATQMHNRAAIHGLRSDETHVYLASPVSGTGVRLNMLDSLLLLGPTTAPEAVDQLILTLRGRGQTVAWNGKPAETDHDLRSALEPHVKAFLDIQLPWLNAIGVTA